MQSPTDKLLTIVRDGVYPDVLLHHADVVPRLMKRFRDFNAERDLPPDFPAVDFEELASNPLSPEDRQKVLKERYLFKVCIQESYPQKLILFAENHF